MSIGPDRGLGRYDGHAMRTYTTGDALGTNSIQALLQDREGHIWAVRSAGLSLL
jgi:ligand-binding sensor domain-containing protein